VGIGTSCRTGQGPFEDVATGNGDAVAANVAVARIGRVDVAASKNDGVRAGDTGEHPDATIATSTHTIPTPQWYMPLNLKLSSHKTPSLENLKVLFIFGLHPKMKNTKK